jgi:hypothetical protein
MTIGELDSLISQMLTVGPTTARAIHTNAEDRCTLYDVEAALRIWVRNGRAREVRSGMYELSIIEGAE